MIRPGRKWMAILGLLLVGACGGSQPAARPSPTPTRSPSPSPSIDIAALAEAFAGTYSGSWTNTTFNSTGPVTALLSVDRPTLTVNALVSVGGRVFGGPPPPPETFSGKLGDLGALGFAGHSTTFGDFTVAVTGPIFVMKAQNVPTRTIDHFEADGTFTGTKIDCTYKVFFKDGTTANGVCSLSKA